MNGFFRCDWTIAALIITTLALNACGSGDNDASTTPIQDELGALHNDAFFADRLTLAEGESTYLRWDVPDATQISIVPDIGSINAQGNHRITPAQTTNYTLTATVDGEQLVGLATITVRPLAAVQIIASTRHGMAPLKVRLTPVPDSLTAINRYYWDFEGDGGEVDGGLGVGENGFDQLFVNPRTHDVTGRDMLHIFKLPGTYKPRVRVWDDVGNQAEASMDIVVDNAVPTAYLRATPTSGQAPLSVSFTIESSDNEGIESYEWDFDGDGIYDSTTTSTRESYKYELDGKFQVGIRVTDTAGESVVLTPIHMQVSPTSTVVPNISMSARPTRGNAPLKVDFRSRISDPTRSGIVEWEWDFDGDGVVDSRKPSNVSHTFDRVGNFYPTVKIIAADGTSSTDILNIVTQAEHSLSIENAAINPEASEVAKVAVSLKGSSRVGLTMENSSGESVRTLWPLADRATGDYSLRWDGTNDRGITQPPGDYYAVLRYTDDDNAATVVDYRVSSGGSIFYPSDWGGGCKGTDRGVPCGLLTVSDNDIEPFNGQPSIYEFSIPHIARMTAYVTVIGSIDYAPATFFRSYLLGPGEYKVGWHGEGTNGKFLPRLANGGYLPAIYGLTASDNTVMLTHLTTVENLQVTPDIVYPASRQGREKSVLSFDLSHTADIVFTVDSTESGVEVLRRTYQDIRAGSGRSIEWDGRGNSGERVSPGAYRLSVWAADRYGQSSLPLRTIQRVQY